MIGCHKKVRRRILEAIVSIGKMTGISPYAYSNLACTADRPSFFAELEANALFPPSLAYPVYIDFWPYKCL
ncbi:unnamed protein product [Auanema sp. JU1783]|nr:unnamed protein product [Auanema sp. JU1783]